jgi:starch-binding outer membrane protein, SusD/RagB family
MKMTRRSARRALAIPGALAVFVLAGCNLDDVLKVQPADLIPAVDLERPVNAALLVSGAIADFDCAFNSFVVVGGLLGEELEDALQTAARWPYDQRNVTADQTFYSINSCTALGVYSPLQAARVSANNVGRLLNGWTDAEMPAGFDRTLNIARMQVFEAWSQLFLAEAFCETVFSTIEGEIVNHGGRITRVQALDSAVAQFSEALTTLTGLTGVSADSLRLFATAGRARAYLDQRNMAGARTDAAAVIAGTPAGWQWVVTASNSNTRRQNRVFQENGVSAQPSASVGLRYRTLNDPRVPVTNLGTSSSGTNVPRWRQNKYTTVTSPIPVVTRLEMQLIVAEADRSTDPAGVVATLNTFRAAGNQGPYAGATDAASLLTEIIDQRRRALWLTGTHFPDLIRYDLQVAPLQGSATPWGQQFGPDVGSQMCLPLPNVERDNNPSLH